MAYIDQTRRPSLGGMAAVIAVHAAIGLVLMAGLTVAGRIIEEDGPIVAIPLPQDPPPPPPETPPEARSNPSEMTPPITAPKPIIDLVPTPPRVDVSDLIPPSRPLPQPGPAIDRVIPAPTPSFAPVGAKPRNDPGQWITADDYRSDWIRRGLVGRASFRLDVAANGTVTGCRITSSTGHEALDQATCRLVSRRARFEPARGPNGEPVAGSYSQSVLWRLPE